MAQDSEACLPYLGATPPGATAKLFMGDHLEEHPWVLSRSFNMAFSPLGDELFFSYYKATEEQPLPPYEIRTMKCVDGQWTGPVTASFSGHYSDVDISFSPDGNYLFYASERPPCDPEGLDIFFLKRTESGWSEPIHAGFEANTIGGEVLPYLSQKGSLFFRSERGDNAYIFRAKWHDEKLTDVRMLPPEVNTKYGATDPCIAPDESYILFVTMRPENGNVPMIYISFQIEPDDWTEAVSLGETVNVVEGSSAPTLSSDGKYLFFKKRGGEQRGINWVGTGFIDGLRADVAESDD